MLWKSDPLVTEARKQPGWSEFHRECGRARIYFDHIERQGRRSDYVATAFTVVGEPGHWVQEKLVDGRGKTPIAAIADAYQHCGRRAPNAEPWLARMVTPAPTVTVNDFDDILGGD